MRTAIKGALLATGAVLASTGTVALPASAEAAQADQTLEFRKGGGPTTGTVTWTGGSTNRSWQAGSGNGGNWSNPCVRNEGHLPSGTYQIQRWYDNYDGSVINGRAIHLEDKQCADGTWRTELFVHSEQTEDNEQGGTEGSRWDGEQDYKSEGCVKMNPTDIGDLFYKSSLPENGARPTVMTVVG